MVAQRRYTSSEVAEAAGIARDTLLRWLRKGKVEEPSRDRNDWRIFTKTELNTIVRYANRETPSPKKKQRTLALKQGR